MDHPIRIRDDFYSCTSRSDGLYINSKFELTKAIKFLFLSFPSLNLTPFPNRFSTLSTNSADTFRISYFASNYLQTKPPHQIRPNSCAAVEAPIRACHMAYRRKQVPTTGPSTFESPFSLASPPPPVVGTAPEEGEAPSLAAQAIRASAAHRDSSLSSAYGDSVVFQHDSGRSTVSSSRRSRELNNAHEYTSMKNLNESKYGFFGNLARKAKAFLDEENLPKPFEPIDSRTESTSTGNNKFDHTYQLPKSETPPVQKKSTEAIASSLSYIGGTLKNAFEEGKTIVGSTTQDIIQETRKLNIRRKGSGSNSNSNQQNEATGKWGQPYIPRTQTDYETQLKASRDVANAMAAKAKLLLRELKTVKADLAFAKERCAQLEDENKILRESHDKGGGPEDDDLIRLQLETLLAEKSRLAHENSVYARENRFLREIVEYHQLTMQDVIYVDEGIEEVTEVYPTQVLPPVTPNASKRSQKGQFTPSVVSDDCPVVPTSPKDAL